MPRFLCHSGTVGGRMAATATHQGQEYDIQKGLPALAFRLLIACGVLAGLSLAILVAGKIYGRSLVQAGHNSSAERFEIVIGNDVLSVPANNIRTAAQRRNGVANRLDIYLHWPDMSGFNAELADAFNDISPETNSIVFVSVVPRATTRDMAGRFDAVYKNVMLGAAQTTGFGLKRSALAREHGYIGEHIVYSAPDLRSGRRFVARCQEPELAEQVILAPCTTDIHFGETLSAQVRFPVRLLSDWKVLNAELQPYLESLLVNTAHQ